MLASCTRSRGCVPDPRIPAPQIAFTMDEPAYEHARSCTFDTALSQRCRAVSLMPIQLEECATSMQIEAMVPGCRKRR